MGNPTVAWNPRAHPLTRPPRLSYQNYTASRQPTATTSPRSGNAEDAMTSIGGLFGEQVKNDALKARNQQEMELGWLRTSEMLEDVSQPYGITFHYNPTDIQLSSSPNGAVVNGQTLSNTTDTSNLLGTVGTSYVQVKLYLNRIYDMNGSPKDYPVALGKTPESEDHWEMLRKLGTQWDIEFLYRAVNGKPQKDKLLPYKTADFGVLTTSPVDIHLGPLAWRGAITSMSVNHILFTPDYIPTFSIVDLGLQRQVTMGDAPAADATDANGDGEVDDEKKKSDEEAAKKKAAEDKAKADAKKAAEDKKKAAAKNVAKRAMIPVRGGLPYGGQAGR